MASLLMFMFPRRLPRRKCISTSLDEIKSKPFNTIQDSEEASSCLAQEKSVSHISECGHSCPYHSSNSYSTNQPPNRCLTGMY